MYPPIDESVPNGGKSHKRVAYIYDSDVSLFMYEPGHNMKPFRVKMTHSLVTQYGLHKKMEIFRAKPASRLEMTRFHTDEYINFLYRITPENINDYALEQQKHGIGWDCPVFDGLFDFCSISTGGSLEAAARLARNKCDIAINWAGGLHHAKKESAGGFCYVNDIVLGILELLRTYKRVLYIDIDIHHGDGVEEAFYTTDRVMTVSFHKYGDFYPGTGEVRDIGVGPGKGYAVNFPLRDGIDDPSYKFIFESVISKVMEYYRPEAVVLQCGTDSLSGDRLGGFNLSMRGHANCVAFVKSFNVPTIILGGGGYTMRNVARTWTYETALLLEQTLSPVLPFNEYYEYYGPDYDLDVRAANVTNANSYEYLEKIQTRIIENLKSIAFYPSVQMQDVPREPMFTHMTEEEETRLDDLEEDNNKDTRHNPRAWDKRVENDLELEESDTEDDRRRITQTRKLSKDLSTLSNEINSKEAEVSPTPGPTLGDTAPPVVGNDDENDRSTNESTIHVSEDIEMQNQKPLEEEVKTSTVSVSEDIVMDDPGKLEESEDVEMDDSRKLEESKDDEQAGTKLDEDAQKTPVIEVEANTE
ncbi:hypothetical protein B7463_g7749, partial [Scytalidium lignicola]